MVRGFRVDGSQEPTPLICQHNFPQQSKINENWFWDLKDWERTGSNHDDSPWGCCDAERKRKMKISPAEATSIIIIISNMFTLRFCFSLLLLLLQSVGGLITKGKSAVLKPMCTTSTSLARSLFSIWFHSPRRTRNYALIINPPFMCCIAHFLPISGGNDLRVFNQLHRRFQVLLPARSIASRTIAISTLCKIKQTMEIKLRWVFHRHHLQNVNSNNMSSQWSESRQQINVISRPSSRRDKSDTKAVRKMTIRNGFSIMRPIDWRKNLLHAADEEEKHRQHLRNEQRHRQIISILEIISPSSQLKPQHHFATENPSRWTWKLQNQKKTSLEKKTRI